MAWKCGILLMLICLAGCSPVQNADDLLNPPLPDWTYSDLRLVDQAESEAASQDILALYTRIIGDDAQIRLDYLDYPERVDHDLALFLGAPEHASSASLTGEPVWSYAVLIPAEGSPQLVNADNKPVQESALRVERDAVLDRLVISLRTNRLNIHLPLAWIGGRVTLPGQVVVMDDVGPVTWQGVPPARTPVLIGFWNTFTGNTPAQALRSWDGAHTGPDSSRHGLRNLLSAVERTGVPVGLLDLLTPANLSALEHLGSLEWVRELEQMGLLWLPEVSPWGESPTQRYAVPAWAGKVVWERQQELVRSLGISGSWIVFFPGSYDFDVPAERSGAVDVFIGSQSSGKCNNCNFLCDYDYAHFPHIDSDGLTLLAKRWLANAAARGCSQPFFLGGDLSASSWGEPQAAFAALSYLSEHPWMVVRSAEEIYAGSITADPAYSPQFQADSLVPLPLFTPSGEPLASGLDSTSMHANVLLALKRAQPGKFTDLAWQMYSLLVSPETQDIMDLRTAYMGHIGHLLAASRWANASDPGIRPIADCGSDLDWDGLPECTLASDRIFAVFDSQGGGITIAAVRNREGFTQFLAPTFQFLVGMGDPSTWDPTKGLAGDPTQLFAFTESPNRWKTMEASVSGADVSFSLGGEVIKTFSLTEAGLKVIFHSPSFHTVAIPVVMDPMQRFTPGWSQGLVSSITGQEWVWSQAGKQLLRINSNGMITALPFHESKEMLQQPEDPNYAYPSGHFVPFPFSLLRVEGFGPILINLEFPLP